MHPIHTYIMFSDLFRFCFYNLIFRLLYSVFRKLRNEITVGLKLGRPTIVHRRSQDFLWGCTFLDQKWDDLFLVVTGYYMVICIQILPRYLVCGGAPHKIQLIFASFQQKTPRNFFSSPWGVHRGAGAPAPPAPPGYAYAQW